MENENTHYQFFWMGIMWYLECHPEIDEDCGDPKHVRRKKKDSKKV